MHVIKMNERSDIAFRSIADDHYVGHFDYALIIITNLQHGTYENLPKTFFTEFLPNFKSVPRANFPESNIRKWETEGGS